MLKYQNMHIFSESMSPDFFLKRFWHGIPKPSYRQTESWQNTERNETWHCKVSLGTSGNKSFKQGRKQDNFHYSISVPITAIDAALTDYQNHTARVQWEDQFNKRRATKYPFWFSRQLLKDLEFGKDFNWTFSGCLYKTRYSWG